MKNDDKLREIIASRLPVSETPEGLIEALRREGYLIISKDDLREAIDAAAKRIAETFVLMPDPPERKQ